MHKPVLIAVGIGFAIGWLAGPKLEPYQPWNWAAKTGRSLA